MLSQASTSMLFFIRVKAVYSNSTIVTGFIAFAWFVNLGISISVPLAIYGNVSPDVSLGFQISISSFFHDIKHIGPTNRCITTLVRSYAPVTTVVNTTYDTSIFLMISFKIVSRTIVGDNFIARLRCFLTGKGLPYFAKSLLQGGQLYYL